MTLAERSGNTVSWQRQVRVPVAALLHKVGRIFFEDVTAIISLIKNKPQLSSLVDQEGKIIAEGILVNGLFYRTDDEGGFTIPRSTDKVLPLASVENVKPQ